MTDKRPALIVDGLSMFHSCAGPAASLTNGYTYSFITQLTAAVKRFKPKGIMVCWDSQSKRRLEIHPGYKAGRVSSMNDTKRKYLQDVKQFLTIIGADQFYAEGYEADDIGAMFANTLDHAVLVSADKDWLQLVRPGISVWQKCRQEGRKAEKKQVTHDNFGLLTGYSSPEEFVRALCAMGDGVDGIDGIYGIGEATIKAFLMDVKIAHSTTRKLEEFFAGDPLYLRNRELIDLRGIREIPNLTMDPGTFRESAVKALLEELQFASMLRKFPEWVEPYKEAQIADVSPVS